MGPNADLKKWEEEQMGIASVRFGAKNAKEKNKVRNAHAHTLIVLYMQLVDTCTLLHYM